MKESNSGNDNNQEINPVEIDSEDDIIQSNRRSLPNSNKFSSNMTETLGASMNNNKSLKIIQDDSGRASILRISNITLVGDTIQINEDNYTLIPEIYETLSLTSKTGKSMNNDSITLRMNNIKNDLNCTGVGDKSSKRKTFLTKPLPDLDDDFQYKTFEEIIDSSDDLQGKC